MPRVTHDPSFSISRRAFLQGGGVLAVAAAKGPVVVFMHQRLDVANEYAVKSAAAVRGILSASGKVAAVFQGHNHLNERRDLDGVAYLALEAAIEGGAEESNAFAVVTCSAVGVEVAGRFRQASHRAVWPG